MRILKPSAGQLRFEWGDTGCADDILNDARNLVG